MISKPCRMPRLNICDVRPHRSEIEQPTELSLPDFTLSKMNKENKMLIIFILVLILVCPYLKIIKMPLQLTSILLSLTLMLFTWSDFFLIQFSLQI